MASFLNAELPSEDEADESYDPDCDPEESKPRAKVTNVSRRGRGIASGKPDGIQIVSATEQKRKAKAANLFAELQTKDDARQKSRAIAGVSEHLARARPAPSARDENVRADPSYASPPTRESHSDMLWMRSLGLAPPAKRACTASLVARVLSGRARAPRNHVAVSPATATGEPVSDVKSAAPQECALASREPASDGPEPSGARSEGERMASQTSAQPGPSHCASNNSGKGAPAKREVEALPAQGDEAREHVARGPGASTAATPSAAAAAAATALAAVATGAHRADAANQGDKVVLVETRRFAGQDVEIRTEAKAGTRRAENVQARVAAQNASSGLDAVLQSMTGPRKANVMEKTADDWQGFKQSNEDVQSELHDHSKSSDKYLEKQAFLSKAQVSQYEQERQSRMQADARRAKQT